VFLATSPLHREHKLRMTTAEVLRRIRAGVRCARDLAGDVEFSAEDAARTEPEFLVEAVAAAIAAGATTINLPDTVGYATPDEYRELFERVRCSATGARSVVLSAHCHDDLGLAVANSLAAVAGGARQVECTINGIGERAGNCALEEIAMALRTRQDRYGLQVGIDATRLCATSRLLANVTGNAVPKNKAIVGDNAFAHEAGIHQHGVLQHRGTYEVLNAADVGAASGAGQLVLGKHSGKHALRARVRELGFELDGDALTALFARFKQLADRKRQVFDADLEALLAGTGAAAAGPWELRSLHATCGTGTLPSAAVRLRHRDGAEVAEAAAGDGPVDAAWKALVRATAAPNALLRRYQVQGVTFGEDAQGRVAVECAFDGRPFRGHGVSTDIVEASARAFLDAINRHARAAAMTAEVKL
jgi:2-isopropylmalate synthase